MIPFINIVCIISLRRVGYIFLSGLTSTRAWRDCEKTSSAVTPVMVLWVDGAAHTRDVASKIRSAINICSASLENDKRRRRDRVHVPPPSSTPPSLPPAPPQEEDSCSGASPRGRDISKSSLRDAGDWWYLHKGYWRRWPSSELALGAIRSHLKLLMYSIVADKSSSNRLLPLHQHFDELIPQ